MNNYQPNYMGQGYWGAYGISPLPRTQQMDNQYSQFNQQPQQPIYNKAAIGLQGKSVDSIDVVKAMDIPLDGSISYFPLTDGTAIVTKALQQDGTSKTIIYRPVDDTTPTETPKFVTTIELDEKLKAIGNVNYKDDIKALKRQIKEIQEDITEIKDQKGE